jgi:hypothetical protein
VYACMYVCMYVYRGTCLPCTSGKKTEGTIAIFAVSQNASSLICTSTSRKRPLGFHESAPLTSLEYMYIYISKLLLLLLLMLFSFLFVRQIKVSSSWISSKNSFGRSLRIRIRVKRLYVCIAPMGHPSIHPIHA